MDLQTDLIGIDILRVVVPLSEEGHSAAFPGLPRMVEIDDARWIIRVREMAAVLGGDVSAPWGSTGMQSSALDILIDGVWSCQASHPPDSHELDDRAVHTLNTHGLRKSEIEALILQPLEGSLTGMNFSTRGLSGGTPE